MFSLKKIDLLLHDSVLFAELLLLGGELFVLVDSCLSNLLSSRHLILSQIEFLFSGVVSSGEISSSIGELLLEPVDLIDLFVDDSMKFGLLLESVFLLIVDQTLVVFFHCLSLRFISIIGLDGSSFEISSLDFDGVSVRSKLALELRHLSLEPVGGCSQIFTSVSEFLLSPRLLSLKLQDLSLIVGDHLCLLADEVVDLEITVFSLHVESSFVILSLVMELSLE